MPSRPRALPNYDLGPLTPDEEAEGREFDRYQDEIRAAIAALPEDASDEQKMDALLEHMDEITAQEALGFLNGGNGDLIDE